jgi:hypothetical protein
MWLLLGIKSQPSPSAFLRSFFNSLLLVSIANSQTYKTYTFFINAGLALPQPPPPVGACD